MENGSRWQEDKFYEIIVTYFMDKPSKRFVKDSITCTMEIRDKIDGVINIEIDESTQMV